MDFLKSLLKKFSNNLVTQKKLSPISADRNPLDEINTKNHDFDIEKSIFLHSAIDTTFPAQLSSLEKTQCDNIRDLLKKLCAKFNVQHILARFDRVSSDMISDKFDIILNNEINIVNSSHVMFRENENLMHFLTQYTMSKPKLKAHLDKSSTVITLDLSQVNSLLKDLKGIISPVEIATKRIGGLLI